MLKPDYLHEADERGDVSPTQTEQEPIVLKPDYLHEADERGDVSPNRNQ